MTDKFQLSAEEEKRWHHRILELVKALDEYSDDYIHGHLNACLDCVELFNLDYPDLLSLKITINACYSVLDRRGKF